jgi:hypothetical protein
MNGDGGGDQGIPLGGDGGGGGGGMESMMGGGGGPPSLNMSSDSPEMGEAPEEGQATIHFHKHSHTKERHPNKPGHHVHHVHLKVHSIKFHHAKKPKVSKSDIAEALASAGPPGGDEGEPAPPPAQPGQ